MEITGERGRQGGLLAGSVAGRRVFLWGLILLGAAPPGEGRAQTEGGPEGGVYLRIGEREVSRGEYADHLLEKYGRRALDRFVTEILVREEAARRGVVATEEEKVAWVAETIGKNRENPEFFPWLRSQGLDFETYRERVLPGESETQIILEKMARADRLTDEGLRRMYEERYGVRYRVRVILVREDGALQQALRDWAHQRLGEIRGRLEAGESFEALAREFSESGDAEIGGDLGLSPRGRLDPALERSVFALSPGEVAGPVESEYGYHLVQAMEKKEDQVRARHILIRSYRELIRDPRWVETLTARLDGELRDRILQASATRAGKVLGDLELGADFGTVAAQESSHPSARRNGEVPPVRPGAGTLPAPVEEALEGLKVGALSGPIEAELGYFIVRLEGRGGDETPFEEVQAALREEARATPVSPGEISRFLRDLREGVEIVTPW